MFFSDERVGNLTVVVNDPAVAANIKSQFTIIVRVNYSNPPAHGARIVNKVLSDPALLAEWQVPDLNRILIQFLNFSILTTGRSASKPCLVESLICAKRCEASWKS